MFDLEHGSKILQILPAPQGMFAILGKSREQVKAPIVYVAVIETEEGCVYMENVCVTINGEYKSLSSYLPIASVHLPSYRAMAEYQVQPPSLL